MVRRYFVPRGEKAEHTDKTVRVIDKNKKQLCRQLNFLFMGTNEGLTAKRTVCGEAPPLLPFFFFSFFFFSLFVLFVFIVFSTSPIAPAIHLLMLNCFCSLSIVLCRSLPNT